MTATTSLPGLRLRKNKEKRKTIRKPLFFKDLRIVSLFFPVACPQPFYVTASGGAHSALVGRSTSFTSWDWSVEKS